MGGGNRHSKDRMYITATEWKTEYGGKKVLGAHKGQPLPFDHCALNLTPFETPVCTPEGVVFDILNLTPFVRKHKSNPVTGEPMTTGDIVRLNMAKNSEGQWHCPVLYKSFNNNTHVVAIRTSGNVFTYEAVHELNIKAKNYFDLISGEPFKKSDIITLQNPDDPSQVALRDISNFKYLQNMRDIASSVAQNPVRHNPTSERVMQEHSKFMASEEGVARSKLTISSSSTLTEYSEDVNDILALDPTTEDVNPGHMMSDQRASGSFTSSAVDVNTRSAIRRATPEEIRAARWRVMREVGKKGYVQLQTNFGNINLEIHCDWAPRTSWNFITLCQNGYYDNTKFHRLVRGFCVQGGDPSGTGGGGESAFKKPFRDEHDSRLNHDKRGVLSMANSGENTNGSQFFITFQAVPHLDLKHSIFGRVVGGLAVLDRIEEIESTKTEVPKTDIVITSAQVIQNPIPEANERLKEAVLREQAQRVATVVSSSVPAPVRPRPGTEAPAHVGVGSKKRAAPALMTSSSSAPRVGKYMMGSSGQAKKNSSDEAAARSTVESFLLSQGSMAEELDDARGKKKSRSSSGGFGSW